MSLDTKINSSTKIISNKTSSNESSLGKRRNQVSRACSNCRKTHAACDNERPCTRCVTHNQSETCVDVPRKKRVNKKQKNMNEESTSSQSPSSSSPNTQSNQSPSSISPAPIELNSKIFKVSNTGNSPNLTYQDGGFDTAYSRTTSNSISDQELDLLMREAVHLEEHNKNLEVKLVGLTNELSMLKEVSKTNRGNLIWHQLRPKHALQNLAVSVWKGIPESNHLLVECNRRFVDLVGYSENQLRDHFTSNKLLQSIDSSISSTRLIKVNTAQGLKNVFASINPIQDEFNCQYIIIQMLEAMT